MTTTTQTRRSRSTPVSRVAQLTGNFDEGIVGDLVVGTLTNSAGAAVLPNTAAFMPSVPVDQDDPWGCGAETVVVCNDGHGRRDHDPHRLRLPLAPDRRRAESGGSGPRGGNRAARVEEPAGRRDVDPGQVKRPAVDRQQPRGE